MKTAELTGAALDWAVAKCEYPKLVWGITVGLSAHAKNLIVIPQLNEPECFWTPSTNWSQGGPIIEREKIATVYRAGEYWLAYTFDGAEFEGIGPTPLIAAMRCYVASKLGDEVEIPEELS